MYTGGDTVNHGEEGIEEGYTVHCGGEGIQEKTLSITVWKLYREGHSPSSWGKYTGRGRRQVFSLHTQSIRK